MEVVHYGDPILRKTCAQVTDFESLIEIVDDMFDTMYEAEGIGLAANQVGLDMNLFIIDVSHTEETDDTHVFINGKIVESRGESNYEEGCLSIPGIRLEVIRPEFITFRYQDLNGDIHEEEFRGLLARAIQHEMDHLNGVFIVDRVSSSQRLVVNKELKSIEQETKARSHRRKKDFVL